MKEADKDFAVIGLGTFGGNLCKELTEMGANVLGIDKNPEKVQYFSDIASHVIEMSADDEQSLIDVGIKNFNYVIVSFGDDIHTSILTTLILKEIGVNKVWVKAQDDYHQKVLKKIGADRIIHPEKDMAKRIAHHIVSEKVSDYIELSEDHSIIEMIATEKIVGQTLNSIDAYTNYNCLIIAVKKGAELILSPSPETVLYHEDILVVAGHNRNLKRLEKEVF